MKPALLDYLRCPDCRAEFRTEAASQRPATLSEEEAAILNSRGRRADSYETEIITGRLTCTGCGAAYPIVRGVPRLFRGAQEEFADAMNDTSSEAGIESPKDERKVQDLFSREWEPFDYEKKTIWHWTLDQRIATFCEETRVETADTFRGKLMVDAGCGPAILSMNLAQRHGIEIVAFDMSYVVGRAFDANRSNLFHVLQASVLYPPLADGIADLTYSHGVLHHTYSTRTAFDAIARIARPGGKLYVWLYGKKRGWNWLKYVFIRMIRIPVSRLPRAPQQVVVYLLIGFHKVIRFFKHLLGMRVAPIESMGQMLTVMRDRYTPLHVHEHREQEVADWFAANGYAEVSRRHDWKTFEFFVGSTDLSMIGTRR